MLQPASPPPRTASILVLSVVILVFWGSCSTDGASSSAPEPPQEAPDEIPGSPPGEPAPDDRRSAADILESRYTGADDAADVLAVLETSEVEPMDADARLVYAVLLRTEGRFDDSRRELAVLVEEHPSMADAWFNLALLEHAQGRSDERDSALESALEADPSLTEALAFSGALAAADSRWTAAENSYTAALEQDDESIDALTGLAWVMAKTERAEEALSLLDRAVELEPDFTYARVDRSRVNVVLGNYNAAEDDLDAAIADEPDVPWHYLDRARIRLRHFKDYQGAMEDLNAVESLDPGNFFALVYLAGLHDEERRFTLAEEYYRRVVSMRPDYVWAYLPLGKFSWMNGEYRAAADWFAKAAAEDPSEFSFELMNALSLLRAGRGEEARTMLLETLRRFKRGESAYEVVRFCAERGSDFYAVNALNKETNETLRERLWFYMGAVYEIEGNSIGANAVYERIGGRRGEMEYDLAWAALKGMGGAL